MVPNLQQRVESRVVRSKELVAASTVPVDGVVDLLNVDTRSAGGSEIGKVLRVGQNVVLRFNVSKSAQREEKIPATRTIQDL